MEWKLRRHREKEKKQTISISIAAGNYDTEIIIDLINQTIQDMRVKYQESSIWFENVAYLQSIENECKTHWSCLDFRFIYGKECVQKKCWKFAGTHCIIRRPLATAQKWAITSMLWCHNKLKILIYDFLEGCFEIHNKMQVGDSLSPSVLRKMKKDNFSKL